MFGYICLLVIPSLLSAQTHQGLELVQARLIADSETIVPGRPVTLGLHLKKVPGWHTYWEYSGDSGLATTLDLELPEGFRATALQWPLPHRLSEPGGLEVYAYKDEVLLMVRLFPPATLNASEVEIGGVAQWLVCEKICLPGDQKLSLKLAVADEVRPANTELFARFQQELPEVLRNRPGDEVQVKWERRGEVLVLNVNGPQGVVFDFYPLPPAGVILGHPALVPGRDGEGVIRIPLRSAPADLTRIPGVLIAEEASGKRQGWRIQ
jgi:DsbC/DsbD-like thiol-disulfide interchange protein